MSELNCCSISIVIIIVGEGKQMVDQATVVKREVLWDLEIGLSVKKNIVL